MSFTVEQIASICHNANRALCQAVGDLSQNEWADAPEWQRQSAIAGVQFAVVNPDAPDSAQHDAWMAAKAADGWGYGVTKDAEKKLHPCLVPYDQLPPEQQAKDALFRGIVKALMA